MHDELPNMTYTCETVVQLAKDENIVKDMKRGGKDGGASDAIVHNETGLICDGNDLNSIYDSAVSFFKDENFIKYGRNAQKFSEKFHWNKIVKDYLKLIN